MEAVVGDTIIDCRCEIDLDMASMKDEMLLLSDPDYNDCYHYMSIMVDLVDVAYPFEHKHFGKRRKATKVIFFSFHIFRQFNFILFIKNE